MKSRKRVFDSENAKTGLSLVVLVVVMIVLVGYGMSNYSELRSTYLSPDESIVGGVGEVSCGSYALCGDVCCDSGEVL
jgi:hypothetical protein